MNQRFVILGALVFGSACTSSSKDSTGGGTDDSSGGTDDSSGGTDDTGTYAPKIDPGNFSTTIDNPYFPLPVGTTYVSIENGDETVNVTVTSDTRVVMGVTTVVVHDVLTTKDKKIGEDTYDWYAQDKDGNVWYLGEDTHEIENGKPVSSEGAWEYGKDGALPGIVMPAHPKVGDAYRQEFHEGDAEDMAEITKVGATTEIGLGSYDDVVVTKEWTPVEPDVVEQKSYAPGVGVIQELVTAGGTGNIELIEFTPAG